MYIKSAKYSKGGGSLTNDCIIVDIGETLSDGGKRILCVPLVEDNSDYIEIMRQVDAGELTIEPADE